MTHWNIYLLRDPATHEIRYVGWTSQALDIRLKNHLTMANYEIAHRKYPPYRARWIHSVRQRGQVPLIEALEIGTTTDWKDRERVWIAKFLKEGARLTNLSSGGEGMTGVHHSEATKQKIGNAHRGKPKKLSAAGRETHRLNGKRLLARRMERSTPEERSEQSRQNMLALHRNKSPEWWRQVNARAGTASWAGVSPEERSARMKPVAAKSPGFRAMSPERHSEIGRQGGSISGKRRFAGWSEAEKSEYNKQLAKMIRERMTAEEYKEYMAKVNRASHTQEAEDKRRAAVARQMSDPEQRNGLARRVAAFTAEQKAEMTRKTQETKRAKRLAFAQTLEALLGAA